jgi:hypothetical protein
LRICNASSWYENALILLISILINILGSDVSFWDHLCIYTYFIINTKAYDVFNSLLEQFAIVLKDRGRGVSHENLNLFFQLCHRHYSAIKDIIQKDLTAFKILVRMVALLPINQENMTIRSQAAEQFVSIVLRSLSENLEAILAITDGVEWPSFREGVITLLCIQLNRQKLEDKMIDPIVLLSTIIYDVL